MSGTSNVGGGGPAGDISFNYVPLIDVTFNLIIFFVLTRPL
jgi:biopolymer transport protein ExbD